MCIHTHCKLISLPFNTCLTHVSIAQVVAEAGLVVARPDTKARMIMIIVIQQ